MIPRVVTIFGTKYKVYKRKNLHYLNNPELEIVCGFIDKEKKEIWINASKQPLNETLLHELAHGIFTETGIDQAPGMTTDLEEIIAENISKGFCKIFCDITIKKERLKNKHKDKIN